MNISQKSDMKSFLDPTIKAISTALELPAGIWLFDEEKREFRIVCAYGLSDEFIQDAVVSEERAVSVIKEKFENQKSLIVPDIQASPFWRRKAAAEKMNLKAAVAATLRIKMQVVGGLVVYVPKDITSDLEKLAIKIETFAVEIADRLRHEKGLETLNYVGQLLNAEIQERNLFENIMKSAQKILKCEHVSIFFKEEISGDMVLEASSTSEVRRNRFKQGEGLAGLVAESGESLLVQDAVVHPKFVPGIYLKEKERSMLLSPIKSKDKKVIGVICADAIGLNAFDTHDLMLWESFTRQTEIALQNKKLYEQIQCQRDSQLQAIGKISDALAGPFDLKKILRNIWDCTQTLMGRPNLVEIRLLDKEKNELVAEGFHKELIINEEYLRISVGKGITGWVARHKKSVLINDVSKDSRYIRFLKNTKSELAVPICRNDNLTGVLNIEHPEINAFTDYHQQLAETIANLAAIAIENANRLVAAYDISEAAYQYRNIDKLYPEIQKIISRLMNADNFYILRYDDIQEKLELAYWTDERDKDLPLDEILKKGLIGRVIRTEKPLLCPPETFEELEKQGEVERIGTRSDYRYWLGVPLQTDGKTIGVLAVKTYDDNIKYTETDKEILMFVSEQIAMAIERVRTQEELEASKRDLEKRVENRTREISGLNEQLEASKHDLEKRNKQQKVLIELAQKLTSSIQLKQDDILELIHKNASEIMDTDNMYIALYDEQTDLIHFPLAFKDGKPTKITEGEKRKQSGKKGRTEFIIEDKQSMFCETKEKAKEWYKEAGHGEFMGDELASFIGVPMLAGGKVLGVVATYHPTKDYVYSKDDRNILQTMANIAAIALQNARLYRELADKSGELERKNRELEEKTKQLEAALGKIAETESVLTRTLLTADVVHRLRSLAGSIPIWADAIQQHTNKIIENIKKDVSGMLDEVEKLSNVPQAEKIDVRVLLKSILMNIHVKYAEEKIYITGEIQPDLYQIKGIYTSVSNAIYNIILNGIESVLLKGEGTLTIAADNYTDDSHSQWVRIKISDTGIGIPDDIKPQIFTPFFTTKKNGKGYGLWRARFIVKNLSGNIHMDSEYGKGTTFTILLPKEKED